MWIGELMVFTVPEINHTMDRWIVKCVRIGLDINEQLGKVVLLVLGVWVACNTEKA
jgi:hypothetical protein